MKRLFITIYILMLITLFAIPFSIGPIVDEIFEEEADKLDRDISMGTFYLISEQLKGLDEPAMKRELERLQPKFGYPLGLYRMDELDIDESDRAEFENCLIVEEEDREMLVKRLGDSDLVLTMGGPFPGDDLEFRVIIIFWGLFLIALIGPALGWAVFVNRDIRKIELGSDLFAAGDYSARVRVSKLSSMIQIAAAFNHMAEKTQKVLESQREITNSVSHEIRTPLARIKFSLEMLQDIARSDSGGTDYLSGIGRDVEEIESLVDEMLTYARFGREREETESLVRQEMVSWLKALVDAEQKGIPYRRIHFGNKVGEEKYIAMCEPVYLGWAVRNLIRNASRYSGQFVGVRLEPGDDHFRIHVEDDGPGIPEDLKEKIFEPFFRKDTSRNKDSGGYGLGLAIAKRIILWHKGEIDTSPSAHGGTCFTLRLPNPVGK